MDFNLTEAQLDLQAGVRGLAERELLPTLPERDEGQEFRRSIWDALALAGLAGFTVPEKYGGGGHTFFDYILALEAIGEVESAQVLILASHAAPVYCLLHG